MDMGVFKISGIQIISLGTAVVLMVLLTIMLNRTKVGKAIRATSEMRRRPVFLESIRAVSLR